MTIIIDNVFPDPVVIPRGGSVSVVFDAHPNMPDMAGTIHLVFQPAGGGPHQTLATIAATLDSPIDPIPWSEIHLSTIGLPGVTVENLGSGNYRLTHTQ